MDQLVSTKASSMTQKIKLPNNSCVPSGLVSVSILSCLLILGCGSSVNGYHAVSGQVTFLGNTLQEGTIQFCTDSTPSVVKGGSMIRDGHYQLPREHGLVPGHYIVRITSPERIPNPDKSQAEMSPFRTRERIPAKYNTESDLKIEVAADKSTEYSFDLK